MDKMREEFGKWYHGEPAGYAPFDVWQAAWQAARQPERSEAVFEVGTGWLTSEHQARGTLLYAAPIRFPENWGDENMDAAPEGEMLRLYVQFEEHPTDDVPGGACAATIGFKDSEGWHFAGWCWSHDHFTDGKGKPVAWLPMLSAHPPADDARVAELEARISDLELEAQLETCIREKLSEILTRTANVLKGEPDELTVHSWHDLAEIAGRRIAALDQQLAASREREGRMREAMAHARGWAPIGSQCMKILDAALAAEKGEK